MFRDTDILPDNTYTHVNNGSQTCSWLDHIAMSMFCPSLLLTATSSRMLLVQITVLLQLRLTLTNCQWCTPLRDQKSKHINWKFEDVILKRQFYERLDNMLDAAPGGLLRVNRGSDINRLTDLLTLISNAILKSRAAHKYLGCGNPQNLMYQGRMSEQRSWMLDTGRPWATGILRAAPEVVHLQS